MLNIIIGISVILVVVILVIIFRAQTLLGVAKGKTKEGHVGNSNKVNGILMMLFLVGGTALFLIYSYTEFDRYTVPIASEHGLITYNLFWITMAVTVVVFILTHVLLFWFSYKYQYNPDAKAHFYPHNDKLEMIWTLVPAVVLVFLVFSGWKAWVKITDEAPANAEIVEVVGYQYAWSSRYPGKDRALGSSDFRLIDADNQLGVDFKDKTSLDDFLPREIHIPKGKPVLFKIRARDVIHSVYAPHFRLQMNAVPGLPTQFWFVPTKSTEDMRKETNNPEFQYELVCNKICGKGHFAMRHIIVVDEPAEYEQWYASQKSWISKNPEYLTKVLGDQMNSDVVAVDTAE